jgi:hypothetical protein
MEVCNKGGQQGWTRVDTGGGQGWTMEAGQEWTKVDKGGGQWVDNRVDRVDNRVDSLDRVGYKLLLHPLNS